MLYNEPRLIPPYWINDMKPTQTWKEAHGTAEYIPCGNAYCTEGDCANCETQMHLQVISKTEEGIELTEAEEEYRYILTGN